MSSKASMTPKANSPRSTAWLVFTDPQFLLPFAVLLAGVCLLVALR